MDRHPWKSSSSSWSSGPKTSSLWKSSREKFASVLSDQRRLYADKSQWAVRDSERKEEHTISAALSIMVKLVVVVVGEGEWNVCGECVFVLLTCDVEADEERDQNQLRTAITTIYPPFPSPPLRRSRCRQSSPTVCAQLASGTAATAPSPHAMASIRSSSHRPGPTPHSHLLRANGRLQKTTPTPLSGRRLCPGTLEPNQDPWPKAVVPKLGPRQRD